MSETDSAGAPEAPAHPLARELAEVLRARSPSGPVLLLGVGSGRNIPVLLATGSRIEAVDEDRARGRAIAARFNAAALRVTCGSYAGPYGCEPAFAAALSTHALLHGRRRAVAAAVAAVHAALRPEGAFYATFGSTNDPRCGSGVRIEERTFAPAHGSERGVPHVYFAESDLRSLLANFEVERLEECSAAETAGRWAHAPEEAEQIVHWFVRAFARRTQ